MGAFSYSFLFILNNNHHLSQMVVGMMKLLNLSVQLGLVSGL